MTYKELQILYQSHNIAYPHEKEKCDICKRWEEAISGENPQKDQNGSNY